MKLLEHEGKALLRAYGIETPAFVLLEGAQETPGVRYPVVFKSQVLTGDRMKKGGIIIAKNDAEYKDAIEKLFTLSIDGMKPGVILAEEYVSSVDELYVSISYSS